MSNPTSAMHMLDAVWAMSKQLDTASIPHEIQTYRFDAVSILAHVPGEYWEIDFLEDGSVDFERYKTSGVSADPLNEITSLIAEIAELDKNNGT